MVLGKREHRDANVGKDEILRQKVEQLKNLLGALPRVVRQIVIRIMRLAYAAKQYGHDARQLGHLGNQKRTVRHQHK